MQTIVVGGGIMGLCTAWGLVRSGHSVTVVEAADIPNTMGSSGDQHRLIRHPYGEEKGYARMIDPAFAAWDALWSDLGVSLYHPTGTLVLASGNLSWAETSMADMTSMGIPVQQLDRDELAGAAPMLIPDDVELAWQIDSGGVLLAEQIVDALANHLMCRGVTVATGTTVQAVDPDRGAVILEDGTRLTAEVVIVAAGPWASRLVPQLASRVTPSRQVVLYLEPPEDRVASWKQSPMILDIHSAGGIYVVPPVAHTGLKIGDHDFTLSGNPDADRDAAQTEIDALFESCRSRFRDLDRYRIHRGKTCFYTVEPKEHFIVEPMGRCVVMTGFSGHGFKFGALMGLVTARAAAGFLPFDVLADLAAGTIHDPERILEITSPCLS